MKNLNIGGDGQSFLLESMMAEGFSDLSDLLLAADRSSSFSSDTLSYLGMFMEDRFAKVGLINRLFVDRELRGNGKGKDLVQNFIDQISPYTQVDMVFARFSSKQKEGFDLIKFYENFGFESVHIENGDMLMVNKGKADMFKEFVYAMRNEASGSYGY